jgi:uncharacterized phosphosugar-binding protein
MEIAYRYLGSDVSIFGASTDLIDPLATWSDNVLLKVDKVKLDKAIHEVERKIADVVQAQRLTGIDAGKLSSLRAEEVHLRRMRGLMHKEWLLLSKLVLLRETGEVTDMECMERHG